ncbi:MAG: restriction endonuclease [Bacteroidaceae bacterium]|nr:restriction endonuclease [Bacteroidaceae bacterium]
MKLLIEGYHYKEEAIKSLGRLMGDLAWRDGTKSKNYVGYYYSAQLGDCVFFLPKVVLDEQGLLFGRYDPNKVVEIESLLEDKICGQENYRFLYGFTVWLYRGLKEFVRLNPKSNIVKMRDISVMGQQGDEVSNTYLDIMLSLQRFHEENPDYFTFIVKNLHRGLNKVNWTKTISHSQSIMQGDHSDCMKKAPVYLSPVNKKKVVNYDEELLVIFFSILDYMKRVYGFDIRVNYNFNLLTEVEFENWLDYYGAVRMKQIRYKYFSDKDLKLWSLCNAFFERVMHIKSDQQYTDYLMVTNYHVVFESMVDELLSDKGLAKDDLKEQEDGKRVDHIYAYQGLINKDRIYYIGDSKYYNIGSEMGKYSVYKQYTYARNVIQHNLSLFLEDEKDEEGRRKHVGDTYLIYRDEDTDGYSITPNFFISARIDEDAKKRDYYLDGLKARNDVESLRHFENRLFDRDTLLLQHYDINFLFVLSLFGQGNDSLKMEFRQKTRKRFRENILTYLGEHYQFFSLQLKPKACGGEGETDEDRPLDAMHRAIEKHFRGSIGKVFRPYSDEKFMYVALEPKEKYYEENLRLLSELSLDFNIRHYKLDTNPTDEINKFYELESELDAIPQGVLTEDFLKLEDVEEEVFLIGGWRRDKEQLDWIHEKMLYNVRKRDRKGSRDGMQRIEEKVVAARYLLLYEIGTENPDYELYRIDCYHVRTAQQMERKGYPNPSGNYFVYDLELMPRQFEHIDIQKVLTDEFLAESERRRRAGTAKLGWEEEWLGVPVFKTGREILNVINHG